MTFKKRQRRARRPLSATLRLRDVPDGEIQVAGDTAWLIRALTRIAGLCAGVIDET